MSEPIYTNKEFTDTELLDEIQRIVGDNNRYLEIARRGCVTDEGWLQGGENFNVREVLTYFANRYREEEAYVEDGKKENYDYQIKFPFSTR